jgi:SAM-dependent methyltransferase
VTRDWDAATYDRVSAPQVEWARTVLERLPLEGHETVLDAGCGSGRVTRMLLERLPRGHVVAVDSTPSMVEHARTALDPARTTVFACDLTELTLDAPVDAAFSNAVFHWIADHDALFLSGRAAGPERVPAHGVPRAPPRAASGRAARSLRRGGPRALRRRARLRATEHPGDAALRVRRVGPCAMCLQA